jgi:hypothetical protein
MQERLFSCPFGHTVPVPIPERMEDRIRKRNDWRRSIALLLFGTAGLFLALAVATAMLYWQGRAVSSSAFGSPVLAGLHASSQHGLMMRTVVFGAVAVGCLAAGVALWSWVRRERLARPDPVGELDPEVER